MQDVDIFQQSTSFNERWAKIWIKGERYSTSASWAKKGFLRWFIPGTFDFAKSKWRIFFRWRGDVQIFSDASQPGTNILTFSFNLFCWNILIFKGHKEGVFVAKIGLPFTVLACAVLVANLFLFKHSVICQFNPSSRFLSECGFVLFRWRNERVATFQQTLL